MSLRVASLGSVYTSLLWVGPTNSWSELALHVPSWPRLLASGWTTRYGTQYIPAEKTFSSRSLRVMFWLFTFWCQLVCLITLTFLTKPRNLICFLAWFISWRTSQHVLLFIQHPKISTSRTKADPIIFLSFHREDEVPCLFKNVIFLSLRFIFHTQYFETDDQEFYKTKVCFILNNDVSEMDLVFAEEKYSKSGQLEKVRQHIGKEHPFLSLM